MKKRRAAWRRPVLSLRNRKKRKKERITWHAAIQWDGRGVIVTPIRRGGRS